MEPPALHADITAIVAVLQPTVDCTVISAQEAAHGLPLADQGVLAVHADQLKDPDVRKPLSDLAHAADHLLVVRHDYSEPTLDSLAAPAHTLTYRARRRPTSRRRWLSASSASSTGSTTTPRRARPGHPRVHRP
ncbi:hypothetical protein [Streptomyces sp. NBC_00162]|uniref:hypothetical protein n=1 Tax=Streptomyces sp. NBC_00162 TaxID=2903629 RepID=UPI00214AF342|nr:hypothetical protein [Streptomyces sp. NBC_00162]UUU38029.1 hypothetical protein JIW86_03635 [Streptomyces sp. NBC_00162]